MPFLEIAIAEHHQQAAVTNALFGLRTDPVQRFGQAQAFIDIEVDEYVLFFEHVRAKQLPELGLRQYW